MARHKKKAPKSSLKINQNEAPPAPNEVSDREALIQDTAAVFTCSAEVVTSFLDKCLDRIEDLEVDLLYDPVAADIWAGQPGRAGQIGGAIAAFVAECARHQDALLDLHARFLAVASDEHHHLDPVERYRDLVRARIFTGRD